jgi:hypothetical protein
MLRIANVYSATVFGQAGEGRPAHHANWTEILGEDTIIAGDFNAHSPRWNPHDPPRRNHHFLEELMDDYGLIVKNDGPATRHPDRDLEEEEEDEEEDEHSISIINLNLASPRIAHRVVKWRVLDDDGYATSSNHEIIE